MPRPLDAGSRPDMQTRVHLDWEMRYEGILAVAVIDGVPWAGISGPWPDGHFALTWWPTSANPGASRVEFYSTMDAARSRVEQVTAHRVFTAA